MSANLIKKLNTLSKVPFERWPSHGVKLKAVSANAGGIVNSGITSSGVYFYRKWTADFSQSSFVLG